MNYKQTNQEYLFGIMYTGSIGSYPDTLTYLTEKERDDEFEKILLTKQIYQAVNHSMIYPFKLCKFNKNKELYTAPQFPKEE